MTRSLAGVLLALCGMAVGSVGARAAEREPSARRAEAESEPGCRAVTGGRVWLGERFVEGATVVLDGERIAAVGTDVEVPEGCERIDAEERVVTPGLVDVYTHLGVVEVGQEDATRDHHLATPDEDGDPVRAGFRATDAYNPASTLIPVTRRAGITSALVVPRGGLVSGMSGLVELAGSTQRETVRRPVSALHANFGGWWGSRAVSLRWLRKLFDEARTFAEREEDWRKNRTQPFQFDAMELRGTEPALTREIPVVVRANRASDVEAMVRLAERFGYRLVLAEGAEAWKRRELLAEHDVPVVVDPFGNLPDDFDRIHARADNAALLQDAGVTVAISTFHGHHNVRRLPQAAGNAVRAGLPREAALKAITRTPARIFGAEGQGRLAEDARANLVIWSGDPMELAHHPERVFIGGRDVSLESRQTKLRDRYLELPGTPRDDLPLPEERE